MQIHMHALQHAAIMQLRPAAQPGGRFAVPQQQLEHRAAAPQRQRRRLLAAPMRAAAPAAGIEAVVGLRPEIDAAVEQALSACLTDTDLNMGKKYTVSSS